MQCILSAELFDDRRFLRNVAAKIERHQWKRKNAGSRIYRAVPRETKCLRTNRRRFQQGKSTNVPSFDPNAPPGMKIVPHARTLDPDPEDFESSVSHSRIANWENCMQHRKTRPFSLIHGISRSFMFRESDCGI